MPRIIKILGKPGTGKTTYLANKIIEKINNGYILDDILFLTYSRAASRAMYNKLYEMFDIKRKQLINFGTIYSLAYRSLSLNKENQIDLLDYDSFSNKYGIDFDKSSYRVKKIEELDEFGSSGDEMSYIEGNILFSWWQYLKCIFIFDEFVKSNIKRYYNLNLRQQRELEHRSIDQILDFYEKWESYKKSYGKYEYQDMLQKIFVEDIDYHNIFKFGFIDEAHDFGNLQMGVFNKWYNKGTVKEIYICYDPLQTIYEFTGSDPSIVENIKADDNVLLNKSYRVPKLPWELAKKLAKSIQDQSMDNIISSDNDGDLILLNNFKQYFNNIILDINKSVFFLHRRNADVKEFLSFMENCRLPIRGLGRAKTIWEGNNFKNIYKLLVCLDRNIVPNYEEIKSLILCLPASYLKRGVKSDFKKGNMELWNDNKIIEDKLNLFYGFFKDNIGNISDLKNIILQPKIKLSNSQKEYLKLVSSKDLLFDKLKWFAGTFHSSKGLEADNVVLFDYYIRDNWNILQETRLSYVGVTRTLDKIYLVSSEDGFIEKFI